MIWFVHLLLEETHIFFIKLPFEVPRCVAEVALNLETGLDFLKCLVWIYSIHFGVRSCLMLSHKCLTLKTVFEFYKSS